MAKPNTAEPFLPDERVARLRDRLVKELGMPDDTIVVTYVVPEKNGQGPWAMLGILTAGPEAHQTPFMTQGSCYIETFEEKDRHHKHFVGVPDPAFSILKIAAKAHKERWNNMVGMSNG
jgi:hypothetical protein